MTKSNRYPSEESEEKIINEGIEEWHEEREAQRKEDAEREEAYKEWDKIKEESRRELKNRLANVHSLDELSSLLGDSLRLDTLKVHIPDNEKSVAAKILIERDQVCLDLGNGRYYRRRINWQARRAEADIFTPGQDFDMEKPFAMTQEELNTQESINETKNVRLLEDELEKESVAGWAQTMSGRVLVWKDGYLEVKFGGSNEFATDIIRDLSYKRMAHPEEDSFEKTSVTPVKATLKDKDDQSALNDNEAA